MGAISFLVNLPATKIDTTEFMSKISRVAKSSKKEILEYAISWHPFAEARISKISGLWFRLRLEWQKRGNELMTTKLSGELPRAPLKW